MVSYYISRKEKPSRISLESVKYGKCCAGGKVYPKPSRGPLHILRDLFTKSVTQGTVHNFISVFKILSHSIAVPVGKYYS